ncbi:MAG: translesion DNA synthesis-associated protein ImuA [Pseudomonadales bacterium]
MNPDASNLLKHPDLWRAGQFSRTPETLSTGFPLLDTHLPGNGWPRAGLGEFLLSTTGVGELRLLAPLLEHLSHNEARWIAWVNPPFVPYAPALSALGIDISKILLIHPKDHKDALWALERTSKSGSCSVVLGWLDERKLKVKDTRRLQLAARQGRTFTCLFRPEQAAAQNSMAELRLQMSTPLRDQELGELTVSINKRRGGWPVAGVQLSVSDARKPEEIREQLALWRSLKGGRSLHENRATDQAISAESHARLVLARPQRSDARVIH